MFRRLCSIGVVGAIVGMLLIFLVFHNDQAHITHANGILPTPSLVPSSDLVPITTENAHQLDLLTVVGMGVVNDMAWSPDSTMVALATTSGVWVFDVTQLGTPPQLFGHSRKNMQRIVFSPDGTMLATMRLNYERTSGGWFQGVPLVEIWDVALETERAMWSHDQTLTNTFYSIKFSPDSTLIGYSISRNVWVQDIENNREVQSFDTLHHELSDLTFQPNNDVLVLGTSLDGTQVFRLEADGSASVAWELDYRVGYGNFSADGTLIAVRAGESIIRMRDAATGEPLSVLRRPNGIIMASVTSPDNTLVAGVFDYPDYIAVWDTQSEEEQYIFENDNVEDVPVNLIRRLGFSPDRAYLVSVDQFHVLLWDMATGQQAAVLHTIEPPIVNLAFSPDNHWLAVYYENGQVIFWDSLSLEPAFTIQTGQENIWYGRLAFSPNGEWIAVSSIIEDTIEIWDISSQQLLANLPIPPNLDRPGIWDIDISPDSAFLVGVSADSIDVWEVESRSLLTTIDCRNFYTGAITFSPDGTYLTAECDEMLHVWKTDDWSEVAILDPEVAVTSLNFSPDNTILEAATHIQAGGLGMFAPITLWDTTSWEVVLVLSGEQSLDSAIGTDGSVLANVSLSSKLTLWNTITGDELFVNHDHFDTHTTTFSPDGRVLVTGSPDGSLRLWGVIAATE